MSSSAMKYIMLDGNCPIIFPGHIEHWVMANAMKEVFATKEVTSAGFAYGLEVQAAGGNSISLKKVSKDQDTDVINNLGKF